MPQMQILDQLGWDIPGDGSGVAIAVLDSGFSQNHPALQQVAIAEARSFVVGDPLVDDVGHGTECSSILVAQPIRGHQRGIAPAVNLVVGQIISSQGTGTVEALCQALEWVASLSIDVVAIPSGRLGDHTDLRRLVNRLVTKGTLMVAPVGNPFTGQKGALYPAAYPGVVAVGSTAYVDAYYQWTQPPDVVLSTQGVMVCTTNGKWRRATGTSHATMLTAGLSCLLKSHHRKTGQKP